MYVSMSLPSGPAVQRPFEHEVLAIVSLVAPSTETVYIALGVRSPTVNMVVVAKELEAVHDFMLPQVMFEILSHSGRVVDASYVAKPPTGIAERLADIVLEVAEV